ncbi:MAG: RNA polymerase sigma factor [Actinomycetota bacterium]
MVDEAGPMGIEERWSPGGLAELRALYGPLRRFAGVVGRWDVEPDDLVQEVFAKVLARRRADIDDLGPYLRRAIVNLATDERRRARRGADLSARLQAPTAHTDAYPHELEELLKLDGRVRALMYLVEVEGWPIADAAETVQMSPTAARVALMRARRRLRTELSVESNGE